MKTDADKIRIATAIGKKQPRLVFDTRLTVMGFHFGIRIRPFPRNWECLPFGFSWTCIWLGPLEFTLAKMRSRRRPVEMSTSVELTIRNLKISLRLHNTLHWSLRTDEQRWGNSASIWMGPLWIYASKPTENKEDGNE